MKKVIIPVAVLSTMAALLLVAIGCNVSTASLSNVRVCEQIDGEQCPSDMSTIGKESPSFYVSADIDSAPTGTKIKIDWRYLSGEIGNEPQDIDSVSLTTEEGSNNLQSSLQRSAEIWPRGEYEVVLKIETDNAEPVHKPFSVK
ncbi:MAG: hypothetical protein Q7K29_03110 [Thermoleophilia bacterium]|nr:hypothetical protein [Thermoleophilia bacterium]